ncbi:MAG: PAS domain-containing protein [Microbacter sp.]
MSNISNHSVEHLALLWQLGDVIQTKQQPSQFIKSHRDLLNRIQHADIIAWVDQLVKTNVSMNELKPLISKVINTVFEPLNRNVLPSLPKDSFLFWMTANNEELIRLLSSARPLIKRFVAATVNDQETKQDLSLLLAEISKVKSYYELIEQVLFPTIEAHWSNFRCVRVMWSIHDDIVRNIKTLQEMLNGKTIEKRHFNSVVGNLFFDMFAIRFREEKILIPSLIETVDNKVFVELLMSNDTIDFPFCHPEDVMPTGPSEASFHQYQVHLSSGELSLEQLELIFRHLPFDLTYVDEHDVVQFYSNAPDRIFMRTRSIIGRTVQNCHPHESVAIVNQIIEAFRKDEKSSAEFWLQLKDRFIYIKYLAVRDADNQYRGVLEITQDITAFQHLTGERRLLDWTSTS